MALREGQAGPAGARGGPPVTSPRVFVVDRLRCGECRFTQRWVPDGYPSWADDGVVGAPGKTYRVNNDSPIETVDWREFPQLRCRCRIQHDLHEATARIDALDRFARHAGGVLENMFVSYSLTPEKDELKTLVEQYHGLFPAVPAPSF